MKKTILATCMLLVSLCAIASNGIVITEGTTSFLREYETANVVFNWNEATWDITLPLSEHWGSNNDSMKAAGKRYFVDGFNDTSKKLRINDNSGCKYRIEVHITNLSYFTSPLPFLTGYRHRVSGSITVVANATNETVCVIFVDSFVGGRDTDFNDSYTECMEDLGKKLASL